LLAAFEANRCSHAHHPRRQLRLPEHHGGRATLVQDRREFAGKRRRHYHNLVMRLHGPRENLPPVNPPFLSPLRPEMHRLKRTPLTTRLVEQCLIRRVVVGTAPVRAEHQHVSTASRWRPRLDVTSRFFPAGEVISPRVRRVRNAWTTVPCETWNRSMSAVTGMIGVPGANWRMSRSSSSATWRCFGETLRGGDGMRCLHQRCGTQPKAVVP
jgi:hypothetical protein